MKLKGYSFVIGDEKTLKNKQYKDYYLFGKTINMHDNYLDEDAYNKILDDIQGDLFSLYKKIFEERNKLISSKAYFEEITKSNLDLYSSLLKANKNLILTGAPGTGKTYLAKQIAAKIILNKVVLNFDDIDNNELTEIDKNILEEQCEFVQFHTSLNYTDFM